MVLWGEANKSRSGTLFSGIVGEILVLGQLSCFFFFFLYYSAWGAGGWGISMSGRLDEGGEIRFERFSLWRF